MKKILFVLVLSILLIGTTSVSDATNIIGVYCFNATDYAEAYRWKVEHLGGSQYQITGGYVGRNDVVVNGGGLVVTGNHMLIVNEMGIPSGGYHGSQVIDLNLSTLTGTNDQIWHNVDGSIWGWFEDIAITNISCTQAETLVQETGSPYTPTR